MSKSVKNVKIEVRRNVVHEDARIYYTYSAFTIPKPHKDNPETVDIDKAVRKACKALIDVLPHSKLTEFFLCDSGVSGVKARVFNVDFESIEEEKKWDALPSPERFQFLFSDDDND